MVLYFITKLAYSGMLLSHVIHTTLLLKALRFIHKFIFKDCRKPILLTQGSRDNEGFNQTKPATKNYNAVITSFVPIIQDVVIIIGYKGVIVTQAVHGMPQSGVLQVRVKCCVVIG